MSAYNAAIAFAIWLILVPLNRPPRISFARGEKEVNGLYDRRGMEEIYPEDDKPPEISCRTGS